MKDLFYREVFHFFSISEKAEIAFPIYFSKGEDDLKILHIDSHYRFFTGIHRNGFYFSAGLRYTFLEGREGGDFFGFTWEESEEIIKVDINSFIISPFLILQ